MEERIQELEKKVEAQEEVLAKIYHSVESTRKMILWSGIATIVTFVLPLIIVVLMLPRMINTLTAETSLPRDFQESLPSGGESLSDTLGAIQDLLQ